MNVSRFRSMLVTAAAVAVLFGFAAPAWAQDAPPCPKPANLPPANSPVLSRCTHLVAHPVNVTVVEQATYQYYIKAPQSLPSQQVWAPYDEEALTKDFWTLWNTGFLDNIWIETIDEPFENGVPAKHIIYHIEERSRLKAIDYVAAAGTKTEVEVAKLESTLRDRNIRLNLDAFVDESTIRKVIGVIREVYAEKGYNDVTVETKKEALPAGPKLVHLTFEIDQGPKYKLRQVVFDGNTAFSDATLRSQIKENKPSSFMGLMGGGTYLEAKFAEDAELVNEFYLNKGYVQARVGQPQVEKLEDSRDGKTRWILLRVPVDEGKRFKVGTLKVTESTAVSAETLQRFFKIKEGDYYSYEEIKKGLDKISELYGQVGYYQFAPDVQQIPRGIDPQTGEATGPGEPPAIVDVTVRMVEGKRFYVNRIEFLGNTTTHDTVARREMRVYEGNVFNAEALKQSVKRLNQLGYFKPLEGKPGEIDVTPTPGKEGLVDIKLKFEEQNRNQISFGAGVSQFDGFFGQLSFQTSNFLGRGETFGLNLQKGSRARQYQVSFSEPYLMDRPITVGADVYARQFVYDFQFTQDSVGTNLVFGYPLADFVRMFATYSWETIKVYDINPAYLAPGVLASNPILRESLLLDLGGRRQVSKIVPSVVYNTVDHPIFPSAGARYTTSVDLAGLGGNTQYVQVRGEGIKYVPLGARRKFAFGFRGEAQWIKPFGATTTLPIFEKFFLGGEYSVRGFDIRSIGPRDPFSGIVTGGNKSLLFNGEFYWNIGGPVRVLAFYDAGQVKDVGQNLRWYDPIIQPVTTNLPLLTDPFASVILTPPGESPLPQFETVGKTPAFKTSTGFEVRFFMPVLNVPFRFIGAYNPSRRGVLGNNLQIAEKFTFRFAVGTTF
jgi:outer membrane protein insertion porin family